jgi:hypothetical protein
MWFRSNYDWSQVFYFYLESMFKFQLKDVCHLVSDTSKKKFGAWAHDNIWEN